MSWYKQQGNTLILNAHIAPNSSRTEIVGLHGDSLKIKIKAPAQDGKANEELVRFLSEKLNVPKRNIEIVKGHTQKKKFVEIVSCDLKKLAALLESHLLFHG